MPQRRRERDTGAPDRHGWGAIFPTLVFLAAVVLGTGCLLADPRPSPESDADTGPGTDAGVAMATDSSVAQTDADNSASDAGPLGLADCPGDGLDGGLIDAGADAGCPDLTDAGTDASADAATDSGL